MQSLVPVMAPNTGERLCRFVGDRVRFELKCQEGKMPGWRALLRTNLGRGAELRREILEAHTRGLKPAGISWRDIPMKPDEGGWSLELPLAEVGYFKAKAYAVDPRGWQHWPEGPDLGISVHPDKYRTANTIYCAFTRLFGPPPALVGLNKKDASAAAATLDELGYAVIPPSGKLRDLKEALPHIVEKLGCRILHLLPVNPTPTTYARYGRFGSPYAALDLTAIDPALVVFDKRSTGVEQFQELTYTAHLHGAVVFLDIVINHTGWGSVLQECHPEWFLRQTDSSFLSPGAWGVTWEDLVELKHQNVGLWDKLSEMFLTWCRRGVDGFRCDAGYKVPVAAWQYIVARVQQEYPETIFLLEGLGGAWEATEALLTEGGMQWAYSELFQNDTATAVAGYLDHCLRQTSRVGLLVHYSETHDNTRLAARGPAWSLLRNRLCGLTSVSGGFGFTCGVEWLATEKIRVHDRTAIKCGNQDNILPELARLNRLLAEHPCFFDGARLTRLSPVDSAVYALLRESEDGTDTVLVLVNTSLEESNSIELTVDSATAVSGSIDKQSASDPSPRPAEASAKRAVSRGVWKATKPITPGLAQWVELLGQTAPASKCVSSGTVVFELAAASAFCLSPTGTPNGDKGGSYRRARAQAAWAVQAMGEVKPVESIPKCGWRDLAQAVDRDPAGFLCALSAIGAREFPTDFLPKLPELSKAYPQVVLWTLLDVGRVSVVPPGHWLLIQNDARFRASLLAQRSSAAQIVESIVTSVGQVACFAPRTKAEDATLSLELYDQTNPRAEGIVRFLPGEPEASQHANMFSAATLEPSDMALLTNGRGGMARLCVDLGRINSKYDCVLGANLHPTLPVDRHIMAKRIRVWANADGFLSPLDLRSLASFASGSPCAWNFVANAGDGRTVEIRMTAAMLDSRNTTVFQFSRPTAERASGKQLPETADVRLTVRVDIEDRNFHSETKRNGGADYHFSTHTRALPAISPGASTLPEGAISDRNQSERFAGFAFTPAADRVLRVVVDNGLYHPQPEWSENIPHPIEQSRGQVGGGDAFSPGWFELPLVKGATATLVVTAETGATESEILAQAQQNLTPGATEPRTEPFESRLLKAVRAFVVARGTGKTVIAGYPWFLDWGRDTFICARGLLAAGMNDEVGQLVLVFGRFERDGTLPNTIFGEDASNRDTSDAPLWYGLVCEELKVELDQLSPTPGRSIRQVLESIALNYVKGTPNGIRMDPNSGLIWSPSHFTWMDTNYPAGTPREGYPVEIQALWVRLLRQLVKLSTNQEQDKWQKLATQAQASLEKYFWREDKGYYADALLAKPGQPASEAVVDDALRSNCLLVVSLGLSIGERARRCVAAAARYLVVPGALRSLAPLPVSVPLAIYSNDGRLLNDPNAPYWGHYEGDEDTRRKPAYHNGTAWTWPFPVFCEALARAWDFSPAAVAAARAYLGTMNRTMDHGCLGHVPEIMDGDLPHTSRGCDAQAWGATEALRVWKLLR